MELPHRAKDDVYVTPGSYTRLVAELQAACWAHDWSPVIAYPFDNRTRLFPFRWLDKRIVPCGARSVAASLLECGFYRTRIVLQQWNPKFSPSATVRAGYPIDLLLISAMGLHADQVYRMIQDAHTLGADRPLIVIGGPKPIYEPEDCFSPPQETSGRRGRRQETHGEGVDVAVTGEVYVLLELLRLLVEEAGPGEHPLKAFRRVRQAGLLDSVPGLVYRAPDHEAGKPYLVNTGVQRLMRDLDELPMPLAGYTCLEPVHRRKTLGARPWPLEQVRRQSPISTLETTHGCRFNCDFCPVGAYQQRTWRHKSPQRIADEMKQLAEAMQYRHFFGADDSFFNNAASAEAILSAMAESDVHGRPFREAVHFVTEATEFDVYKNRHLLPLARKAGLQTLFFGIEDLNAKFIDKGQTTGKTEELFRELRRHEIAAGAMMIHHDDQLLWSTKAGRLGVVNQALKLFELGAMAYHTTYITPSMGARNVEKLFTAGHVFDRVGGNKVPEAFYDGTHVIASRHRHAWIRQLHLWLAYLSFYNPINFTRTLLGGLHVRHHRRRLRWQVVGGSMIPVSILKSLPFTVSLALRQVDKHPTMPPRCLPMVDAHTGERVKWGIDADVPYEVTRAPRSENPPTKPPAPKPHLMLLPLGETEPQRQIDLSE